MTKINHCICGIEISYRAALCRKCYNAKCKENVPTCCDCGIRVSHKNQKRCQNCKTKFYRGKNHHSYKGGLPKCLDCDNRVTRKEYIRCDNCNDKYLKEHPELHSQWNGGLPKCCDCDKQLSDYDSLRCKKCANTLENHPNWKGGISFEDYPREFNDALKEEIRARDNYQCQGKNCTITEEEHLMVFGTILHVHHIDYNKKNLDKNNLITTCISCNSRANVNRIYWQQYYTEKIKAKI